MSFSTEAQLTKLIEAEIASTRDDKKNVKEGNKLELDMKASWTFPAGCIEACSNPGEAVWGKAASPAMC